MMTDTTLSIDEIENVIKEAYAALEAAELFRDEAEKKFKEAQNLKRIAETPIIWKNIFNTSFIAHGPLDVTIGLAQRMGYPYVLWNEIIVDVESKKSVKSLADVEC